jgi:hypothetical protein
MSFILTDCSQPACHGGYPTLEAAQKQADALAKHGLCESYSVGTYIDGKFVEVYNSNCNFLSWSTVRSSSAANSSSGTRQ